MAKTFNCKRFLRELFGSPQGLLSFLRAYGSASPGAPAVEKWFQRESVPSGWLVILLAYLEVEHGAPISLNAYLEGD